jgi:hypothetical protein
MALLYAILVGLDRINATQILQYNGAFQQIVGLPRFPEQTALRRFLRRLRPGKSGSSSACTTNSDRRSSHAPGPGAA